MGQTLPKLPERPVTEADVNQCINLLFTNNEQQFKANDISMLLQQILQSLRNQIPIELTESKIILNPFMLRILSHEGFSNTVSKLIHLLVDKLQQLMKRNVLLIKTNQWKFLSTLASLILMLTDDKLLRTIEAFAEKRQQLNDDTRELVEQLENQGHKFTTNQHLINKMPQDQVEQLCTCLISTMLKLINQRIQPFTSSYSTLQVIQQVEQVLFMLFTKQIFASHHHKTLMQKARNTSLLKDLLKIGEYFMGSGCNLCVPSVYESAVLLLLNLISGNHKHLKLIQTQVNGLPSHLFKNLPVARQKTFYDFVTVCCLYSLSCIKEGDTLSQRFGFNRLVSLKLISVLVKEIGVTSGQVTEMLEEVSLQMKVGMVERAFMTQIVQDYVRLVDDKIMDDKRLELLKQGSSRIVSTISSISSKLISRIRSTPHSTSQIAPSSISTYCRQSHISQILTKYLQSGIQPFSIKYQNKRYTVPYTNVVEQIEKDEQFVQKQLYQLSQKFIYEFVLKKKVVYQHSDKFVWSEILPKIIHGLQLQGEQVRESQVSSISSNIKGSLNVRGQASVISRKPLTTKNDENRSSKSQALHKASLKLSRYQTEEHGIYNQTTEQAKIEYFKTENKIVDFAMDGPLGRNRESKIIRVKRQKQNQEDSQDQYEVQNSDNLIYQPEIDKEELIFKEEDLFEEDVKIEDN